MQYPRIVSISHRRHNRITRSHKARIVRQSIFGSPAFEVKGRVRHYVVNGLVLVQVISKSRSVRITEVMGNSTNSEVHLTESPSVRIALLTDDRYFLPVAVMTVNEFQRLHEHTARTTAGVIYNAAVRLNHLSYQFNNAGRCIEFTVLLSTRSSVHLQEVFINSADKVFLLKTLLSDLINIVDKVFDF